jgi:hypothetical protein
MQISQSQMQEMHALWTQDRALQWQRRVDAAVPRALAASPAARLAALADAVISDIRSQAPLAPLDAFLAVDVRQTADWLQAGLAAGVSYREIRAAALLLGAAALGALWFVDDRLLPTDQLLAPGGESPRPEMLGRSPARLMAAPQGARFREARTRERQLRPGLRLALQQALEGGLTPELARTLLVAAFDEGDLEDSVAEERPASAAASERFMTNERSLLAQAGIAERDLQTLCMAGDLVLGLGRCARLLSGQGAELAGQSRVDWLRGAIDDLAGLAR